MTVKKARELLGEEAEKITDEEIERDIETAKLFKNIFFEKIIKKTHNFLLV